MLKKLASKSTEELKKRDDRTLVREKTRTYSYLIILKKTRRFLFSEKLHWHDVSIFEEK